LFRTGLVCLYTQYVKLCAQIRKYEAEDIFDFLKYNDQELTVDCVVEIRKQRALEEAAEPKEPEPKERTMMVSKMTEERIVEIERGSTRSQSVENSIWKRIWTCRKTDYVMNGKGLILFRHCLRNLLHDAC
jgi:hypothetical protein